jgi:type II secretory pathway pseudopilin PulG
MREIAQRGQALLVILLVTVVILTISLAVISRSVTDLRTSRQDEDSARTFSVAEAGIEQLLLQGGTLAPGSFGSDYQVSGSYLLTGNSSTFDFGGGRFDQGTVQTLWLVGHNAADQPDPAAGTYSGASLTVHWGNKGQANDSSAPALEATLFYDQAGFKVARYPFDPNASRGNNFSLASYDGGIVDYPFRGTITLPGGTAYALRLKPLYNSQAIGLKVEAVVGATFPAQGNCCESTATRLESGITRKVQQCRFYEAPPAIFDYVLYAGASLVK